MKHPSKPFFSSLGSRSSSSFLVLLLVIIPVAVVIGFLSFYSPPFSLESPSELLEAASAPTPAPLISAEPIETSEAASPFSSAENRAELSPPPTVRTVSTVSFDYFVRKFCH